MFIDMLLCFMYRMLGDQSDFPHFIIIIMVANVKKAVQRDDLGEGST